MPTWAKMIPYRTSKAIPYPTAHTYIAHILEYPPAPGVTMSPKHCSFLLLIFTCLCFTKPLLIIVLFSFLEKISLIIIHTFCT